MTEIDCDGSNGKGRRNMTKMHENVKEIAVQKPKLMTFREFVEFRKKFGDDAVNLRIGHSIKTSALSMTTAFPRTN